MPAQRLEELWQGRQRRVEGRRGRSRAGWRKAAHPSERDAKRDGHEAPRKPASKLHPAEVDDEDDGQCPEADDGMGVGTEEKADGDEGERDARQRGKQRGTGR